MNKGMVCTRLRPPRRFLMSTTMVIATTTMRVLPVALPPIPCRQNTGRLFITDLPSHRRRPCPSVIKRRRISTLMRPGERFLHGGGVCVPAVSYPAALCSMVTHTPGFDAFMPISPGMLYRAAV